MPELPEVEVIVRGLAKNIKGLTISRIGINSASVIRDPHPRIIHEFEGRTIKAISRKGKYVVAEFMEGGTIITHLGMTGKLLVKPTDEKLPKHSHVVFDFKENCRRLIFHDARRYGKILYSLYGFGQDETKLSAIGVDPLIITSKRFSQILSNHKRMIKPLLLDQTIIAGLGNIYVDEALFDAGIHPRELSHELDSETVNKLHGTIRRILNAAIKAGGSTINSFRHEDGGSGHFQLKHRIYGKAGQDCPRCGNTIEKINVGGRTSSICTHCQKPPILKPTAKVFRDCWWGQ